MYYLYLKEHNKTGLKYLGQTKQNPYKYTGSGIHWKRHLKKHGDDINTTVLLETNSSDKLKSAGLYYSKLWNVVESDEYANMVEESGAGGRTVECPIWWLGAHHSEESKQKIASAVSGVNNGMYGRTGNKNPFYGKKHTEKTLEKLRRPKTEQAKFNMKNAKRPIGACPHCGKIGALAIMKRWHFDRCRSK